MVITDVASLQTSDDPISNHIDSILCGQFNGKGNKYLGFRITNGSDYNYGWIKMGRLG